MQQQHEELMTLSEFARVAGISLSTARRMLKSNSAPPWIRTGNRRGRIYLITRGVLAWLQARIVQPESRPATPSKESFT